MFDGSPSPEQPVPVTPDAKPENPRLTEVRNRSIRTASTLLLVASQLLAACSPKDGGKDMGAEVQKLLSQGGVASEVIQAAETEGKSYGESRFGGDKSVVDAIRQATKKYQRDVEHKSDDDVQRIVDSVLDDNHYVAWPNIHAMIETASGVVAVNHVNSLEAVMDNQMDSEGKVYVFQTFEETQDLLKRFRDQGKEFSYLKTDSVGGGFEISTLRDQQAYDALISTE